MNLKKELRKLFPLDLRFYNGPGKRREFRPYSKQLNVNITENMEKAINIIVESDKFWNKSEFIRYLVNRYIEEIK